MKELALLLFLISFQSFAQNDKNYRLVLGSEKSDLNYKLFDQFGSLKIYSEDKIRKAFIPKKGKFVVYVFVAEYMGDSFDGTRKLFHDQLILKADPKTNAVIDGFHYTMEWAEPPAISDLYRVMNTKVILKDRINLDQFRLQLEEAYRTEYRDELNDHGVIFLK